MRRSMLYILLCLVLAGCEFNLTPPPAPTVANVPMAQTALFLTQNAPPPGFEQSVQFPEIDDGLSNLPSWHYTVELDFAGVFTGTTDPATGTIQAEVFSNELTGDRRVLLKASGDAFGLSADRNVEAVRIRNDYYLVDANKVCTKINDPGNSRQVADLAAGKLIGGVKMGLPMGQRKTDNKVDVWEYSFSPDDVIPPTLQVGTGGQINVIAGDLWVAPSAKGVWQYTVTFDADNILLQGPRALTGKVQANYQLIDTGIQYNIAIPYGC